MDLKCIHLTIPKSKNQKKNIELFAIFKTSMNSCRIRIQKSLNPQFRTALNQMYPSIVHSVAQKQLLYTVSHNQQHNSKHN